MNYLKHKLMDEAAPEEGAPTGGVATPSGDAKWYDSLPEDMRGDQNITKFDSVETMAKSWQNAQRLIGADKIPMPTTDDDWSGVYDRLGRPETAEGYEMPSVEGVEINEEIQASFRGVAHELGLNQKQVEGIAQWEMQQGLAGGEQSQASKEAAFNESVTSLKAEWGDAFEQNTNIAVRAAGEFLSESDTDFINSAEIDGVPLGNHPTFLKMFNNIGKAMMENKTLEGIGNEGAKTPQDIEDERNTLMANPAYIDKHHPEHKQIMRKVQDSFNAQFG